MFAQYFKALYGRDPIFVSTFSGCGGADMGLEDAGLTCVGQCEIDQKAQSVLRRWWPEVPLHDDVATMTAETFQKPDLLWASPPCQAFSVAGARKGLDDPRGQLTLTAARLMDAIDPEVIFIENVTGLISEKNNALGCLLGYLAGHDDAIPKPNRDRRWKNAGVVIGPRRKIAYRVIDSQGFVPQRRRRVLIVAVRAGSRVDPVRMLFESEDEAFRSASAGRWGGVFALTDRLQGSVASGRSQGQEPAMVREEGSGSSGITEPVPIGNPGSKMWSGESCGASIGDPGDVCYCLETKRTHGVAYGITEPVASFDSGFGDNSSIHLDVSATMKVGGLNHPPAVAFGCVVFDTTQITNPDNRCDPQPDDPCHPLTATGHPPAVGYATCPDETAFCVTTKNDRLDITTETFVISQQKPLEDVADPIITLEGSNYANAGNNPRLRNCVVEQVTQAAEKLVRWIVRRLTPLECERLQGWPDGHTETGVKANGKTYRLSDSARYKLCGNGVTLDVAHWLAYRLMREYKFIWDEQQEDLSRAA